MTKDASRNAGHNWELIPVDTSQQVIVVPGDHTVTVGRQTSCDFVLADKYISREHALLEVRDGGLFLKDLESTQGTFVNEEPVSELQIQHGDNVRFEKHRFTVRQLDIDVAGKEAVQQDAQATIIRKVPDFEVTADHDKSLSSPVDDIADSPVASSVAVERRSSIQQEDGQDSNDVEQPGDSVIAQSLSSSEPVKPAIGDKPETMEGDESGKSDKGEWWVPQSEGPKGTKIFKVDPDAAVLSAQKVDVVSDCPMLIGLSGDCRGQEFRLKPGKLILGKGDTADVLVNDGTVSDWHAQIIGEGMTWKVVDLISSNGTYVNGKKTRTAYLSPGDIIRMGDVELQYVNSTGSAAAGLKESRGKKVVLVVTAVLIAIAAALGIFALSYYGVI